MENYIKNKYQIIYLNGASSAGKSTLSRSLQEKLKKPFLTIGIDQLIKMMPEKLNDWNNETKASGFSWLPVKDQLGNNIAYKIHIGPFGKKMGKMLKNIVITLAKSGHNIIIDTVSFGKVEVDSWQKMLKDFNVLWIGVIASAEILEQREKERGDRKIGSACWQSKHVHVGVNYDLMIDTHIKSVDENVEIISQYMSK